MNQDIATVQQLLVNHGFDVGPAGADGIWGADSQKALVAALQAAHPRPDAPTVADENDDLLIAELRRDEGTVLHAYQDKFGYWTIGTGRLVDERRSGGISGAEADVLLLNDIRERKVTLDRVLPWWRGQTPARQRALQNLLFSMGWDNPRTPELEGLSGFTAGSLKAWEAGDYERAAAGIAMSRWAKQVQASRRDRVVSQIRNGL